MIPAAVGLLVLLLAGCEEDVLMAEHTDRPFTLYGVFSPQLGRQSVRVYTVEDRLVPISPEPLAVTFTTTDLQRGETRVWNDSLIQETHGSWVHVFWSPFRAEYGHTYHVEVAAPDGSKSRVTVSVPPKTDLVLPEPGSSSPERLPIHVHGDAPRLIKILLEYRIRFQWAAGFLTTPISIQYDEQAYREAAGWVIPINLTKDFSTILEILERDPLFVPSGGVALIGLTLRLIVASEDWAPPGGVFDPEVLAEPGTMSNVDNGFGFVGAGYRDSLFWRPPEEIYTAAGFSVP